MIKKNNFSDESKNPKSFKKCITLNSKTIAKSRRSQLIIQMEEMIHMRKIFSIITNEVDATFFRFKGQFGGRFNSKIQIDLLAKSKHVFLFTKNCNYKMIIKSG